MRQRLHFDQWPAAVYAIGDIHGCLAQLQAMERQIVADAATFPGEKWIVTLGDYIDRGPNSAGVIAHTLGVPPPGFKRFALIGNHEEMMLDFLDDPLARTNWLEQGGIETLASYGIDLRARHAESMSEQDFLQLLARQIPREHIALMKYLPVSLALPGWFFVHAGIRPGVPLSRQVDEDLIWIRSPFRNVPPLAGVVVVHGHTPVEEPILAPGRIAIDTGCCWTGRLTALRVKPDGSTMLLTATA